MGFGQWLGLLALLAALMLLWNLRGVLLVLFAAVVLAVALNLPVRAIQRCYGWRRSWGLLVVLLALSVAVLVGSVVLAPSPSPTRRWPSAWPPASIAAACRRCSASVTAPWATG